jgi:putative endonuclease
MWWVYILKNKGSNKFYVGCASNLNERVKQHQFKKRRRWTGRQVGSWEVIYKEPFQDKRNALTREKEIKRQKSRKYIERLIKQEQNS